MRFKRETKGRATPPSGAMTSIPMTGDALTRILRDVYRRDPATALAQARKELVDNQGFSGFKTKAGGIEILAVMKGDKRFTGATDEPEGLETVEENKEEA